MGKTDPADISGKGARRHGDHPRLCKKRPAPAGSGGPQGRLRQGVLSVRRGRLYRRAGAGGQGRRPQRQRPCVSGGAPGYLAHRGGKVRQRHALSAARIGGTAGAGGGGAYPHSDGSLRRGAGGLRPRPRGGDRRADPAAAGCGKAAGAGRRRHKCAVRAYRSIGVPA